MNYSEPKRKDVYNTCWDHSSRQWEDIIAMINGAYPMCDYCLDYYWRAMDDPE